MTSEGIIQKQMRLMGSPIYLWIEHKDVDWDNQNISRQEAAVIIMTGGGATYVMEHTQNKYGQRTFQNIVVVNLNVVHSDGCRTSNV